MDDVQAMTLQNGFEMGNGFSHRIRVLNGFARLVLAISRAEVEGGRSWIPSSIELFSAWGHCVCRWVASDGGCKLPGLEQGDFLRVV
jgi:hypothetical protein